MAPETLAIIVDEAVPKGDVIAVARLAGIMAAKRTHELIPLCHQLNLTRVAVDIEADEALPGLRITTEARLRGRTGVEMEALVAASVAALTVYDMCKAVDRGMEVTRRAPAREERRPQRALAAGRRRRTCERPAAEHPEAGGERPRLRRRASSRSTSPTRRACASSPSSPSPSSSSTASRATPTPGPGTARSACSPTRASRRCKPSCPTVEPRRVRREHHHRGHHASTSFRSARGSTPARRCSRSRRSARCATTAARSSTRPATA